VKSRQTIIVYRFFVALMVAWKSAFLLQCLETKEVLLSGLHFNAKRISLPEADDVV